MFKKKKSGCQISSCLFLVGNMARSSSASQRWPWIFSPRPFSSSHEYYHCSFSFLSSHLLPPSFNTDSYTTPSRSHWSACATLYVCVHYTYTYLCCPYIQFMNDSATIIREKIFSPPFLFFSFAKMSLSSFKHIGSIAQGL